MRAALAALGIALLCACSSTNAPACQQTADCERGVCSDGFCIPQCHLDLDCGTGTVCVDQTCVPPPHCLSPSDCAVGYSCEARQCRCVTDSACARNEACLDGVCQNRPTCRDDAACAPFGLRCEPSQGLCVPPCSAPSDCAPGADPLVATALYACVQEVCHQRCVNDASCGGQGTLVCLGGLCRIPECFTRADCPAGRYCTRAQGGVCEPYVPCADDSTCPRNFGCSRFPAGACPPGVDCAQPVCRRLPSCAIDADCQGRSFCDEGHCQPSRACDAARPCTGGQSCVGGTCVPGVCRGHPDCEAGRFCSEGACVAEPSPAEIAALTLFADARVVEVDDPLPLSVVAFRAGALAGTPIARPRYGVDGPGRVDGNALVATGPGLIRVTAGVPGSTVTSAAWEVHAIAAPRPEETAVVVIDGATLQPLANVRVRGCHAGGCLEASSSEDGSLRLGFRVSSASFTAAAPFVRSDGLPAYDRASILGTSATTVVLPLRPNPLRADAPWTFGFSLADAPGNGAWWVGLAVASTPALPDRVPRHLLGEPFVVRLPGINASATVPSALSLAFRAEGFGGPLPLKPRSHLLGTTGERGVIAFGGKIDVPVAAALGGAGILAYVGGLGATFAAPFPLSQLPWVPDTDDLNGNGNRTELRPAWPSNPSRTFSRFRPQRLRTEVASPALPSGLDTAILMQVAHRPGSGALPLGISARTAGGAAPDGTRPVAPLVLQSSTPAAGYEAALPGVTVIATALDSDGLPFGSWSIRETRAPRLPERVAPAPLLPLPAFARWDPATRTLTPDGPSWQALGAAGAEGHRFVLQGADSAHVVWIAHAASPRAWQVPPSPQGAGSDAAASSGSRISEESAFLLADPSGFTGAVDLRGASWARPGGLVPAASSRR